MHLATDNRVSYLQNPSGNCAKCCDISFHSDSKCDRIHTDLYFSRYHILDHNGRTTLPCKDIPVNFQENVLRNYELFRSRRWNIVLDVSPSFYTGWNLSELPVVKQHPYFAMLSMGDCELIRRIQTLAKSSLIIFFFWNWPVNLLTFK